MTPDELRTLADAIVYRDSLAIARAADYLRAQADAQPVAWVDVTDSYEGPYIFHGKELLPAGRHDLYTRPAPAAPQPEPKRPAFLDEIDRAKEHVASWPQWMKDATVSAAATLLATEPKRDPACLWSRADDDTDVWETKCGHAFTIIDGTPTDNQMAFCCYCGRRVDEEIGGGDAGTD